MESKRMKYEVIKRRSETEDRLSIKTNEKKQPGVLLNPELLFVYLRLFPISLLQSN